MGKKRVAKKGKEEVLREREKMEEAFRRGPKMKRKQSLGQARIYISSSYNNTKVTLADEEGNIVLWSTAGKLGFRGTKKGTPFAASRVADFVADGAKDAGAEEIDVYVRGIGAGRESALRSLAAKGLNIVSLQDITPIPHNGPRPRKARRV